MHPAKCEDINGFHFFYLNTSAYVVQELDRFLTWRKRAMSRRMSHPHERRGCVEDRTLIMLISRLLDPIDPSSVFLVKMPRKHKL